jgi:two-component system, NtrC family, sensor kinase
VKTLFFTLFLALICSFGFSQKQDVFRIDSLPKQGSLLDKGWKWHTGDNPNFAKIDFDDSKWESIDPTKDIHEFPALFDSQVRWLRLTLHVIQQLPHPLGLSVNQATGSQVYLNGKLIQTIGQVDTPYVQAQDPLDYPFYLPIDSAGTYHLAVRLAVQPRIHYTRLYALTQNNVFNARLVDLVKTQNGQRDFRVYYTGLEVFKIGLLFMLFVLHLSFYLYEKSNKTHLFLSIYFLGAFMQYVFKIIGQNTFSVEARYWYLNFSTWSVIIGTLFALWSFYRLSKTRFDVYFIIVLATNIVGGVLSSITYGMLWSIMSFASALINFLVTLRLTRIGLKKKDKGFIVLGVAVMLSSVGFVFIELLNQNVPISPYVVDVFFNLSAIAIPVGLSLYMGIEASERNKELQARLTENENLKVQAITQEQEKQQILETQNETLERQVAERTAELKASQNQLIQKEKLASLGELTAGIAHEIQNPLNFVNNFSEMSVELAQELKDEVKKQEKDWKLIEDLAEDLAQNQQKINLHGKRASSIVSGMLEHSRASTGERVLTDINKLADEYLRLSYHGIRAKDNSFNSDYKTDFDENLPKIKVIPQDMGRVLLNLINNAFWAVKTIEKPLVVVTTSRTEKQIIIKVSDNGIGISEEAQAKIFQPFFTTKPTGQGTGLGLSLAYDIVTKGHGGTIECESVEGEGTTFFVKLPI